MILFTATIYKNIIYDSTALKCVNGEPVCPFKKNKQLKATGIWRNLFQIHEMLEKDT